MAANQGGYRGKGGFGKGGGSNKPAGKGSVYVPAERSEGYQKRDSKPAFGKRTGGYQGNAPAGEGEFNKGGYKGSRPQGGSRGGYQGKASAGEGEFNKGGYKGSRPQGGSRGGYQGKTPAGEGEFNKGGFKGPRGGFKRDDRERSSFAPKSREAGDFKKRPRPDEREQERKPADAPQETESAKARRFGPDSGRVNELTMEELENRIFGRNPVKEALKAKRTIDRLYVQKDATGSAREILALARDNNLIIQEVDRFKLDQLSGGGVHQGFVALIPAREYASVEDILARAKALGEPPLVVVLDEIEDPHNLGSILRSALCSGAHGVIIPKRRSTGLTAIAVKASSGAAEHLPVAKVVNIQQTLEKLKKEGLWIAGADMAGTSYDQSDLKGPLALVIGAEGRGLGHLVGKTCDFIVSIPMKGELGSLNASVAAGILLFEAARQRRIGS